MKSNAASHIPTFIWNREETRNPLLRTCLVIEDSLTGVAAAKAASMRVAAIPDTRFVDPREYEKEADYVLGSLSEIRPSSTASAPQEEHVVR